MWQLLAVSLVKLRANLQGVTVQLWCRVVSLLNKLPIIYGDDSCLGYELTSVLGPFSNIPLRLSNCRCRHTSPANLQKYRRCEQFAAKHGIVNYKAGRGIGHQIMVEEAYAWPGTMSVASDSHSVHYGAVGCLGTPIVRTDAASIFATSRTWWQVPPVARVTFLGKLPLGVTGKDVIVALCGLFTSDVLNHAVEFTGSDLTLLRDLT